MKRRFYAQAFDGLNTASAPHLIEHSEFQEAENVSYAELGAIGPLPEDTDLWAADQGVQGVYGIRYGGVDHVFAAVDAEILEDGVTLAGLTAGTGTPSIVSDSERVYIMTGATAGGNFVYDGTYTRDHGGPTKPSDSHANCQVFARVMDISAFSNHASAPMFTSNEPLDIPTGSTVTLRGLTGGTWSTLDDTSYVVTRVNTSQYTISADTSALGAFSDGDVQVDGPATGLSYLYAQSTVVVIDGNEVESSLVRLWHTSTNYAYGGADVLNDLEPLVPGTNTSVRIYAALSGDPTIGYVSPTTGVTYKLRVYRTKGNGDTFYQLKDIASADLVTYRYFFTDYVKDADLGAAWLYDLDANDTPPACTMGVICQQRLFIAGDLYHPRRLYYSGIGRYDYFAPLDYIEVNDTITALAEMGDRVAVFSDKNIGVYVPDETIGYFKMSLSPVGVEYQVSVKSTDVGILFARNDGAWLFDGNSSVKINEKLENVWTSGMWSVAYTPSRAVFTNQSVWFVADIAQGKWRWTKISGDAPEYISESADRSLLYGLFEGATVKSLFSSVANRTMKVRTRDWGGGGSWRGVEAVIDSNVTQDVTVRAYSTMGDMSQITFDARGCRDRYRYALPRTVKGDYISIEVEGDVVVYGAELVVD